MSYKKYYEGGWQSGEAGGTPITPEALNHMEQGIQDAAPMEYAKKVGAPYNLLDNSDFRNPVNHRGYVSGTTLNSWTYFLDRWRTVNNGGSVTLNANGLTTNTPTQQPLEGLEYLIGKKVTIAAGTSNGAVICKSFTLNKASGWSRLADVSGNGVTIEFDNMSETVWSFNIGSGSNIAWVALYEGEYTAETLPEYQPKGYAAELLECRRYYIGNPESVAATSFYGYAHTNTEVRFTIPLGVAMRTHPSIVFQNPENLRVHCADGRILTPDNILGSQLTAIGVTLGMTVPQQTTIPAGAIVLKVNSRFHISADL